MKPSVILFSVLLVPFLTTSLESKAKNLSVNIECRFDETSTVPKDPVKFNGVIEAQFELEFFPDSNDSLHIIKNEFPRIELDVTNSSFPKANKKYNFHNLSTAPRGFNVPLEDLLQEKQDLSVLLTVPGEISGEGPALPLDVRIEVSKNVRPDGWAKGMIWGGSDDLLVQLQFAAPLCKVTRNWIP